MIISEIGKNILTREIKNEILICHLDLIIIFIFSIILR